MLVRSSRSPIRTTVVTLTAAPPVPVCRAATARGDSEIVTLSGIDEAVHGASGFLTTRMRSVTRMSRWW